MGVQVFARLFFILSRIRGIALIARGCPSWKPALARPLRSSRCERRFGSGNCTRSDIYENDLQHLSSAVLVPRGKDEPFKSFWETRSAVVLLIYAPGSCHASQLATVDVNEELLESQLNS